MRRISKMVLGAGISAMTLASPVIAKSTRSSEQVFANDLQESQSYRMNINSSARKSNDLPAHVGPKDGFPDNRGLARARQVANDNAAFNRDDSPGG